MPHRSFRPKLFLSLVFLLTACSGGAMNEADPVALPEGNWRLVAFVAADDRAPDAPEVESTLAVDPAAMRVSGLAGCNRYTGSYEIVEGVLQLGPLAATKRYCPGPAMAQEERFLRWLADARSATLTDGQLSIETAAGDVLRFEPVPKP